MTTNQEREMLLGKAEKRRGGGRRLLIGAAVVLVVLVGLVAFAVPPIAGAIASGKYPVEIAGGTGTAQIEGVSLSWLGPQKVRRVLVTGPDGATVADLSVRASTGALGALRGDLGTITLGGEVNVPEPGPEKPEVNPGTAAGSKTSKPFEVPRDLRFEAKTEKLKVTLPTAEGKRVVVEGIDATVSYVNGRSLDAALTAQSPAVDLRLTASDFSDAQGRLTLERIVADLVAKAEVPAATVHALAGTAPRAGEAPTILDASLVARDGRLRLADPSKPATLRGSIPGAMLERASGGGVDITRSEGAEIEIDRLDLPLASGADWRTVALHASAHLGRITGVARLGGANEPERALVIEPLTVELSTTDEPGVVTAKGGTRLLLDQQPAGTVNIDALVKATLTASGKIEPGLPERIVAEIALNDVPTGLFDGIGDDLGVPLDEAVGPTLTAVLRARTVESASAAKQPGEIPTTELNASVKSANLTLDARLEADERSIRGPGVAVKAEAKRLAPVLRSRLADAGIDVSGEGATTIEVRDFTLPLDGGTPALGRLALSADAKTGGLTLRAIENPDRPLALDSATASVSLAPGAPVKAQFASRLTAAGSPVTLDGNAVIERMFAPGSDLRFTPEDMTVNGKATLSGVPTDLAGLVPEPWGSALTQSAGRTIGGTVVANAEGPQKNTLTVDLEGTGVTLAGTIERVDRVVRTTGEGLTLSLQNPAPLLAAATKAEGTQNGVRVESAGPVRLALAELEARLPESGGTIDLGALRRLRAELNADPARLTATTESGSQAIELDASTIAFAVADDRRMNLSVNSGGSASGQKFTAGGQLALGALPNDADLIWKSLEPKGTIEAKGVPTALASLVAPDYAKVVREGVGPTVDLAVVAPAPGAGSARSAAVTLRSDNVTVEGPAAFAENEFRVGPLEARATLTPGLVQAGAALAGMDTLQAPTLSGEAAVRATVQQARFRTNADGAPDWDSVGALRAMVALEGDAVIGNLPGLAEGARARFGMRGVEAGLVYDRADPRRSELSAKGTLFDPDRIQSEIATFSAQSALPAGGSVARFDAGASVTDVARLDSMLGAAGLIADSVGATLTATAKGEFAPQSPAQGVTLGVDSPRLKLGARGGVSNGVLTLAEPASGTWEMPRALADRLLLGIEPAEPGAEPTTRFAEPVRLTINVPTFSMTAPGKPLDRSQFKLDAKASAPAFVLSAPSGDRITLSNPTLQAATTANPGDLSVTAVLNQANGSTRTPQGPTAGRFRADALVASLIAPDGTIGGPQTKLTANAEGDVPTALIDALMDHDGLLVDLLGPVAQVSIRADSLSKQSGSLRMSAQTDRASASVQGVAEDEAFRATQPVTVTLTKISPSLSNRVFEKVMPLLAEVQKTESDRPATINATGFVAPLDGDISRLNGVFDVDLGTVSFKTSTLFGALVNLAKGNKEGRAGERFKPFKVNVTNGVATYDRVEVPLGEFSVVTSGTINLATQEIDLVTAVPASSISKEIASAVSKIPVLSNAAMIPIRTRGTFKNNKSEVDPTLILQESLPGNIIRGIGDLLNGNKKDKDNNKKK